MKNLTTLQRLWFYRVLALLTTAVLVHLAAVWAVPRIIMRVLMEGPLAQSLNIHNRAGFAPPVTAASRQVVMPSPDLLYSVCAYDLSAGPLRVQADPKLDTYWSVALYSARSDNYFVLNDRKAAGKPVDLWLVSEGANATANPIPQGSEVVVSPSTKGFLLMRVLTRDYATDKDRVEPARRTLQCTPSSQKG